MTPRRLTWRTLPIRVRLTVTFAVIVGIALALAGLLVHVQFKAGIDSRIDEELADRQAAVVALARRDGDPTRVVAEAGEALLQIYRPDGTLAASSRRARAFRLLAAGQVRQAASAPVRITANHLPGVSDGARVRAFAIPGGVAALGEPLDDPERAQDRLAIILAVTLPGALIAACIAGYLVTRAALRPVDEMRARAEEIGAGAPPGERLPEPGTHDEIDRLAATLNDLLGRLEAAVEHERRILGDASHELRTPVSVLLTRLDVALRRDDLDAAQLRAVLEEARLDARRLSRLADDVLFLARADQGRLPLRPEPLEVHDLLTGARDRHGGAPGVVVAAEIAGGAVVLADATRTGQVLDNLIANALAHGSGPVELRAAMAGEAVAISVRDHGPGYPEAFLPRAFERFSQANPADGGSGLGLSIAEAVVRAQGGTIAAANDPDGGAVVTFTLPAA
ncbi:MAG TPA: HAMP domain-containing sensor histidine kinase [Miltoncostaea sp.]|nr:HAMP domain-containing sensor histidine kinase [Miltoncostaea sp.]